jgi:hypothetical protein
MNETVIVLVVIAVVFMVFREVWCWYWKINEVLSEFKKANLKLERIYDKLASAHQV